MCKSKSIIKMIFIVSIIVFLSGCAVDSSDDSGSSNNNPHTIENAKISENLFGVNMDWSNLANGIMEYNRSERYESCWWEEL